MINQTLLSFARTGLGFDLITVGQHGHILKLLQSAYDPGQISQRIILILLPRASYKTTIAAVAYPMWLLSHNPDLTIMLDSETFGLSKKILSEIKQHYTSPTAPFSNTPYSLHKQKASMFDRWSEDSIILPSRRTAKKEGSIDAAGIDGVRAGAHYDLIIADDLHSQQNTKTQYQIDQVIEHYRLLLPILKANGTLIVIGTRWAAEDAYTIIEQDANAALFIPATSVQPMNVASVPHSYPDRTSLVYDMAINEAIEVNDFYVNFPEALPVSHLEKIEKRQGPYIYSAQYLLKPVASRDRRFREEWLRFSNVSPIDKDYSRYRVMGFVDPAFTTAEYSDFSGVVIVAVDEKRNVHVLHDSEEKLEPYNLIDRLFELTDTYSVFEWFVEEVAAQKVLLHFMEYLAAKQDRRLVITPVKSMGRKKELRIQSLQPYFASGKVYLRGERLSDDKISPVEDSPLLYQIRKFPILKHDDVLDALAYLAPVLYDGFGITTPAIMRHKGIIGNDLINSSPSQATGLRPRNWRDPHRIKCYEV
jgi:predicted phage terminase large subunit-like protein